MKQSRQFAISHKIVASTDLRRLADVFQRQQSLAKKSDHHSLVEYAVRFSDGTKIDSDSSDVLDDDALTAFPARPIAVSMSFHNLSLKRSISLSLTHGESTYDNKVTVSGNEPAWLTENFDALRRSIDVMRPQESLVRRHSKTIVILIAISYASLVHLLGEAAVLALRNVPPPESLRVFAILPPWISQFINVSIGLFWGGQLRDWMLRMWPTIEFDFGLIHLQEEQRRRGRVKFMATAIMLPIIANLLTLLIQKL